MKFLAELLLLVLVSSGFSKHKDNVISRIDSLLGSMIMWENFANVRHKCDEVIRLAESINRPDLKLQALYTVCWSANYHREMDDFLMYLGKGKELMKDEAVQLGMVDTGAIHRACMIHAIGQYYYALGNYGRAIEEYLRIVPVNGPLLSPDSGIIRSAYNYIAQSYYNTGNLDKSAQYFELAHRYINSGENFKYYHALHLSYLAQIQHSMGKTGDAFSRLNNALPLLLTDNEESSIRNPLKSIYQLYAGFYRQLGKYDSAIYFTRESVDLFTENDPDFVYGYILLGDIYYDSHYPDSALYYYSESLKLSESIYADAHHSKAVALRGIGNILRDKKEFGNASAYYKESLSNLLPGDTQIKSPFSGDALNKFLSPREGMSVMVELAKLYFQWYRVAENIELLDSGVIALERALFLNDLSRREEFTSESKESRARLQAEITDLGVEASSEAYDKSRNPYYLDKAFFFMEKNKGNILLDKMHELRALSYSGIPPFLLENEMRIKGELAIYKKRLLSAEGKDSTLTYLKRVYGDKQMEYINLVSDIEKNYRGYYRLKYESGSVTAGQIRKLISSSDKMIIQYYTAGDKIYISGITGKETILRSIPRDEVFNNNLISLLNQMNSGMITEMENDPEIFLGFVKNSRYLYTRLIEPVLNETRCRIKRITIVPDGHLCYLPFEILLSREPDASITDYSDLPYLIRTFSINYGHSASLIFMGDEKPGKNKKNYLGLAPEYTISTRVAHIRQPQENLSLLPASRDEVEACRRIWQGSSLIGNQATESEFINSAGRYKIVHLATHTILNDENPQSSCIVFAGTNSENDEGLLYVHELYNMDLNTRLMILSGCETGTGRIKEGEGIISLARAFRYAGCSNILMSLWKVNDRSTKEIMILFNRFLKKGMDKDKALQQAKLEYLNGTGYLHPAFWASLVLIGDQKPVIDKPDYIVLSLSILAIVALLLLGKKLKLY